MHETDTRGQTEVLGTALVIGMVLLGSIAIVTVGMSSLRDSQGQLQEQRAEKSLSQFDSEAALVALGSTSTRSVTLPSTGGDYHANKTKGWMNITTTTPEGNKTHILNSTLGVVTADVNGVTLGYQGGGVWRASPSGGKMVSPPEFNYRGNTLTLPIISISNSGNVNGEAVINRKSSDKIYPATGVGSNPLSQQKIHIEVTSQFYRGWGSYFEQRTNSEVTYNDEISTVSITLVPPPEPIELDSGVVAAGNLSLKGTAGVSGDVSLGGTTDGEDGISGDVNENVTENIHLESATTEIERAKTRLENESAPADTTTVTAGNYSVSDGTLFSDDTIFNTSNGDITLYVDSNIASGNDVTVTGDGSVTLYVDGEFHMNGQPTWGDESHVDSLLIYSKTVDRITRLHGVLYTGAVDVDGAGGGNSMDLTGALVSTSDDVEMGGNVDIEYHSSLSGSNVQEVDLEFAKLSYMHITNNEIVVK
ncbi:DUF7289 family protein [Salinibaculum rarum]|uniref:DUF7289 family protein n=1 Tax=Salinibaculum rarum TaxID=3058903 RepID=UPI00265DFE88|nr:hypothetical protein [Salinibaculum sp. KK48]